MILLATPVVLTALLAEPPVKELGRVAWGRDLAAALAASADSGRPVFLFFQEVPG